MKDSTPERSSQPPKLTKKWKVIGVLSLAYLILRVLGWLGVNGSGSIVDLLPLIFAIGWLVIGLGAMAIGFLSAFRGPQQSGDHGAATALIVGGVIALIIGIALTPVLIAAVKAAQ